MTSADPIQEINNTKTNTFFEEQYIKLRKKEERLYTDEEVLLLPDVNECNPYKEEWSIRKNSAIKLINYLAKKKRSLKILEIGCGNGWLCHRLSKIKYWNVVGMDINFLELNQAARVFARQPNLSFIYGDLRSELLELEKFDIIVFAASIQYFPSFSEIIDVALDQLNEGGEIHILDTHFYKADEINAAIQRTKEYFSSMNAEEICAYYFHHSLEEIPGCHTGRKNYNYELLYNPNAVFNKIVRKRNPFYWVCIKFLK